MRRPAQFAAIAAIAATVAAVYALRIRAWHTRWGATDDEIQRAMPLDDSVPDPLFVTNRAITVRARPDQIWPWLSQMGELPRGGFYSYEWIERLMGMQVENADAVLPEFQDTRTGDVLDRNGGMHVKYAERDHCIVLGPGDEFPEFASTWSIALYPIDAQTTRVISRVRAAVRHWTPMNAVLIGILDPGQFIMERKFLLELRDRAERLAREQDITRGDAVQSVGPA